MPKMLYCPIHKQVWGYNYEKKELIVRKQICNDCYILDTCKFCKESKPTLPLTLLFDDKRIDVPVCDECIGGLF